MAHNARVRAAGTWSVASEVTPAEFDALDQRLFSAVNADDGGCWAPAAAINLLGAQTLTISGRSVFSRLHSLTGAASSSWTIVGGSGLTFGGTVTLQNASQFILANQATVIWGPDSTATHQSGSATTFMATSTLTFGAGQTIAGTPTFDGSFSATFATGSNVVTVGVGATWACNGTWTSTAGTVQIKGSLVFGASSVTTRTTAQTASGPNGWTAWRHGGLTQDADSSYDASADSYAVPALSAARTYTLLHTSGTIPIAGQRMKFVGLRGASANGVVFKREDATTICTTGTSTGGKQKWWAEFCFYGGAWHCIGWNTADAAMAALEFPTLD